MSRLFTIFVILALMAVVALVPQMGREKPGERGPDLGEGYAYKPDTLRRFKLLLEGPGWSLADPPRNPQGMLETVHERTGLTFVLIPAGSFPMGSPEDELVVCLTRALFAEYPFQRSCSARPSAHNGHGYEETERVRPTSAGMTVRRSR